MLRLCASVPALFVFAALGSAFAAAPPADFSAIDAYVEAQMAADRVPGMAIALVHRDGASHVRGYGSDGRGRPVTPATGFVLGSMSKPFTALAVMQLVEQGRLQLDAPVQSYLPDFRVADPQSSAAITVRQLLQHTSGIPHGAPRARGPAATLQDHVRALADVRLSHPPGAQHAYASPNYQVLGALVERTSGQRFADYLQNEVFAPLGMRHGLTTAGALARGHRYWFGWPIATNAGPEPDRLPTAAVAASAQDLAHFLRAQLDEGRHGTGQVLSPAGLQQMHAPGAPGSGFSYGLGWRIGPIGGVPAIHHGGVLPHFRGKLVLLPDQGWGVAVLANASTTWPLPFVPGSHRMADAIAGSLAGRPLVSVTSRQTLAFTLVSIGMALVLLSQLKGLVRIDRWRARLPRRSPAQLALDLAMEGLWPIAAVVGVPWYFEVPWPELLSGTPDLAGWLATSAALGLATAALKLRAVHMSARATFAGH